MVVGSLGDLWFSHCVQLPRIRVQADPQGVGHRLQPDPSTENGAGNGPLGEML